MCHGVSHDIIKQLDDIDIEDAAGVYVCIYIYYTKLIWYDMIWYDMIGTYK